MTTLDTKTWNDAWINDWMGRHDVRLPNPAYNELRTALESLPPQSVEVTEEMVEAALHGRVPGGSSVWVWIVQDDAFKPSQTARDVIRAALEAATRPSGDGIPAGREGLSAWSGWRDWNHQREACAVVFGPAWSLEDESELVEFINRNWGRALNGGKNG